MDWNGRRLKCGKRFEVSVCVCKLSKMERQTAGNNFFPSLRMCALCPKMRQRAKTDDWRYDTYETLNINVSTCLQHKCSNVFCISPSALYWYTIHVYLEKWPHVLPLLDLIISSHFLSFSRTTVAGWLFFNFGKLKTHVGLHAHTHNLKFVFQLCRPQSLPLNFILYSVFSLVFRFVFFCTYPYDAACTAYKLSSMCIPIFKLKPSENAESSTEHRNNFSPFCFIDERKWK